MFSLDRQTTSPSRNGELPQRYARFWVWHFSRLHFPYADLKAILSSSLVKVKGSLLTTEEANAAIVKAGLSGAQNLLMAS
jgi:hypothetical protein